MELGLMNATRNLIGCLTLSLRKLALTAVAAATIGASAADEPAHLLAAEELLNQINSLRAVGVTTESNGTPLNRYGGSWTSTTDPSYIRFADLDHGILPANNTKCSPLVTHLLKAIYGWNWKNYSFYDPIAKTNKSVASPAPYQYIRLVKEGKGFAQQIPRLDQVQPGDILSWWTVGSDSNDHTMIITGVDWDNGKLYPSWLTGADPALTGTMFYPVRVIDSTSDTHTDDSRVCTVNGVAQTISGIGSGTVGLLVNANYEIVGRTWSLPTSNYTTQQASWLSGLTNRLRLTPTYEIVIGRMPVLP